MNQLGRAPPTILHRRIRSGSWLQRGAWLRGQWVLGLVLCLFPGAGSAAATTRTVDTNTDQNIGSCPVSNCSLRDALALSNNGDTIVFSVPASSSIDLSSGLG